MDKRNFISFILHLTLWVIILIGPLQFVFNPDFGRNIQVCGGIFLAFLLFGFYGNYTILIPRLLLRKRIFSYVLSLFGMIVLSSVIERLVVGMLLAPRHVAPLVFPPGFLTISTLLLLTIGLALRLTMKWIEQEKIHEQIKKEQLTTELSFLKNQVSPHFFFNTLNNIYALTESNPKQAKEVTHKLSKLMRYLLYESEKGEWVTLEKEISFLKNYLSLVKIRLPESVVVNFDHGSEKDKSQISPLLFVPFVENAFKHGVSFQEPCFITITLQNTGDNVEFSVINTIPATAGGMERQGGLGLKNIQRRLPLIFGEEFDLSITENNAIYEVKLKIPIHAD